MHRPLRAALPQFDPCELESDFEQLPKFEERDDAFVQGADSPRDPGSTENTADCAGKTRRPGHSASSIPELRNSAISRRTQVMRAQAGDSPSGSALTSLLDIAGVVPASLLTHPPVPMVSSGIAKVDALTGGLPRGCLTEIYGPPSSGRTGLVLAAIAESTRRGELCALVDAGDCFDPHSAVAAGVDLDRLLWIRCSAPQSSTRITAEVESDHGVDAVGSRAFDPRRIASLRGVLPSAKVWYGRPPARSEREQAESQSAGRDISRTDTSRSGMENIADRGAKQARFRQPTLKAWGHCADQALKASDLLLQSGGFGLVVLDFGNVPSEIVHRIPLASWFRFRRAVENTPAVLVTIAQEPAAKTCASLVLQLHMSTLRSGSALDINQTDSNDVPGSGMNSTPTHARFLRGAAINIEIVRSRIEPPNTAKKAPRPVRVAFQTRTEWAG